MRERNMPDGGNPEQSTDIATWKEPETSLKIPERKYPQMPVWKKTACTIGMALGLGGVLSGCNEASPTFPSASPTQKGETPAQSYTPTKEVTSTPEPTATPEHEITAQINESTNTSQKKISQEAADKANSLTSTCRTELSYSKPEEKKPYFPSMTGMSIQGSEITELKIKLKTGEAKFKFGYCNTEMYGYTEEEKVLAPILVVYVGEGNEEKAVFLSTLELKPEDLTPTMLKKVSKNLKEGETLEFVRLVPGVTPEGKIVWPDSTLKVALSTDGSLHLKQEGKELPFNTEKQDEFIPMIVAIKSNGTLRYEITDPVEGRMSPEQVLVVQTEADGGFSGYEVGQWQNVPEDVIEGKQLYSVYHIIGKDGKEYLLAARAGKTPEEALADPYSQLAQAKINEKGEWVWEKKEMPLMDIKNLKQFIAGNCKLRGYSMGGDNETLDYVTILARQIGIKIGPPPGYRQNPVPGIFEIFDIGVNTEMGSGYCWVYLAGRSRQDAKAVYESKFGGFYVIPVKNINNIPFHW